jgi:hypothetical protein
MPAVFCAKECIRKHLAVKCRFSLKPKVSRRNIGGFSNESSQIGRSDAGAIQRKSIPETWL